MSGRVKLSETRIAALRPRNRRYDVWDSEAPGLIVQVTPKGHCSYMLCRRFPSSPNTTRRLIAEVGAVTLEQARQIARDWTAMVRQGVDPGAEARKVLREAAQALTFGEAAEDYISRRVATMRRKDDATREIRQLSQRWGKRALASLTRGDVVKFLEETGTRSPSMATRLFGHLRAMFNWLRERGTVDSSPCDMIRPTKLVGSVEPRQRTLSDEELRAFWIASGELPYPYGPLHRLVLLTGARLREVADAEWREFDLREKVWRVPPERNKSRAAHVVPLSPEALALVKSLPRYAGCRQVFTADQTKAVRNMHTPKAKIDAGMTRVLGREPEPWVVHDLRRVVRSRMAAMGVREEIAERVLGHGPKNKLVRTYNTYDYLPEVRKALERWGKVVKGLDAS